MELFWKAIAAGLLCAVLGLTVEKREFGLVLSIGVCCMVAAVAATYLEPALSLLRELEDLADTGGGMFSTLLRAVGIGLVAQLAALVCQDAGNASLAKTLQMLGSAAILYISIPVFQSVLNLLREILGGL